MLYKSTRGKESLSVAEAIVKGLADNGGLFVPEKIPCMKNEMHIFSDKSSYQEVAVDILKSFLNPDYTSNELTEAVQKAYSKDKFTLGPVMLKNITPDKSVLELWHGPTFAFKDMALQLLPYLLTMGIEKTDINKEVVILVATSGDTGKAALEGFADVNGTKIIVFYPEDGVSDIQKLQMTTQKGKNVNVFAVKGNFDDAQSGVKNIFNNTIFAQKLLQTGYTLSSANSINWGRLVPQIVYYFYAYFEAVRQGSINIGDKVDFVVPTGNFGNILAGYYAKRMGLFIDKLVCASNENNVLTDFINKGIYNRNREFHKTISPSMDILISSNLERFLYHLTDENSEEIIALMEKLKADGFYEIKDDYLTKMREDFCAYWFNDEETKETIKKAFDEHGYLLDTHTAVAWAANDAYKEETGNKNHSIILSTASPFKFAGDVLSALKLEKGTLPFEQLKNLAQKANIKVPEKMIELESLTILYKETIAPENMKDAIEKVLIKNV